MFWVPDRPLQRLTGGKRIRYAYPGDQEKCSLVFVGFQEPLDVIPAGTLLRVSLAHWWQPEDKPEVEPRCYVQLSGWFLSAGRPPAYSRAKRIAVATTTPSTALLRAEAVLCSVFDYDRFRPLQDEIIENVLLRRDTLVVMPTGGGKSLCYQIPALLFPGVTVVISPLISLMQDQVAQLRELGVPAAFLNSTLAYSEYVRTMQQVRQGEVKLLYVAPETLLRPEILLMLEDCRVDCLAIDEAHCISQWGHDFQPEYRRLMPVRERFPDAVCIALTATATPRVRADIRQILGFDEENEFVASFDRPNLFIEVMPKEDVLAQTLEFVLDHPNQSGIVYCATRDRVDELAASLRAQGVNALPYHAGMEAEARRRHQDMFINGDVPVMVATIAFGMGIDKPDVRFVLHVDLPKNIEHYYQQIGRAGRDGLRADCLLLFSHADVHTIRHFIRQGAASQRPSREQRLQALVRWVESRECRRKGLLAYFGETYRADSCRMCDNCTDEQEQPQVDLTIPAQKFLSCVLRTGQQFGASHIIKVLRGSRAKGVLSRGHDQLSCYGIGRDLSREQWKHLAHQLVQRGLLAENEYGGLQVTDEGRAVLRGRKMMGTLAPIRRRAGTHQSIGIRPDYDPELFQQLRAKRRELAEAAAVPPYVIFSDRSLQEMATYFPQSREAFGRIYGVGRRKLERYADVFLSLIRAYCRPRRIAERSKSPLSISTRGAVRPARSPRGVQIGEAFRAGATLSELAAAYGIKRQTVITHLAWFVQNGGNLPEERLLVESSLAAEVRERVLAAFQRHGAERLRPIFELFEGEISYEELHLLRVVHWNRQRRSQRGTP
ncbi:MAG: DNA helicase RecQ [Chloroflexi bacterium]|nr:MAG: DNA helicase RecQ [Chloroflexota bacterium]